MPRLLLAVAGLVAVAGPALAQDLTPAPESLLPRYVDPSPEPLRFWAQADYLLWFIRGDHAPVPLATTGPAGAPRTGALGEPGTVVLIGPDLNTKSDSGGKLWLGAWLDPADTIGVEATGFCLETHTIHEKAYSNRTDGAPVIARPFFNTLTGQQDAQYITGPADALGGRDLGGIDLFSDSRTWGGELNLLLNLTAAPQMRWDLVGGFRYLGQKDELRSDQSSTVLNPGTVGFGGRLPPHRTSSRCATHLQTNNNFYGGQIGAQGRLQAGPWAFDIGAKVGLGTNEEQLQGLGRTLLTTSTGATYYQPGGLFVPPNLTEIDRCQLGFISEVNLRVGYKLTKRCLVSVGYTFLFWGNIIRPAEQINAAVDPRVVPSSLSFNPAVAPAPFQLHASDFWAQGLTVGLEYRY